MTRVNQARTIERIIEMNRTDVDHGHPGERAGNRLVDQFEPGGLDLRLHHGFVRVVQGLGDARARAGLG